MTVIFPYYKSDDWILLSDEAISKLVEELERQYERDGDEQAIRRQLEKFREEGYPVDLDDERNDSKKGEKS